jgi:sialic acid synthase SpsE
MQRGSQMREVKLGNKTIGDNYPSYIIAEMAWSHDGSVEKAKAIIKGASDAGADAISVHVTSIKDYMVRDYGSTAGGSVSAGTEKETIYDYLNRVNLKEGDWEGLFSYARDSGLAVCAMPNDMQSLNLCTRLLPDSYVIHASCFVEEGLVSEVAKQKKPVILRIGGATLGEIENTINLIRKCGTEEIILLHGVQLYPTKVEDTRLKLIPTLKAIFGLPVGLADHIDADSILATIVPLVALGFGANVIEKHMTHDRSMKGEDYESALNPDEFKALVGYIREVQKAYGTTSFEALSAEELRYRQVSRKRTVAARIIKKGEKIGKEDILFKRSDEGVSPDESKFITGRTANQDIKEDESITRDKIL